MKEIVVGVDASDASTDAVRFAGGLAAKTGAALTVLHVRPGPPARLGQRPPDEDEVEAYWTAVTRTRSARALAGSGTVWTFEARDGDPVRQLEVVARQRGADLVVVGCQRRSALGRALVGSVSTELVRRARHPVLVIR